MSEHPYMNKAACRKYILDRAKITGRKQFENVGKKFWDRVNTRFRLVMDDELHRHPSKGKTLL